MLHKLIFNTTDESTIADSHHVGSHTLSGNGTLIDSKNVNSFNWLNVASILFDGSGNSLTSGNGSNDNIANTFSGLDSRSFIFGYDSTGENWDRIQQVAGAIKVYIDDGDFEVDVVINAEKEEDTQHSSGHIGNYILGVRSDTRPANSNVSDNGDYTSFFLNNNGELYNHDTDVLNKLIEIDALSNNSIVANKNLLDVADTAEDVVSSPLSNRKYLFIYNNDNRELYLGQTGVTSSTGFPLPPGSMLSLRAGASVGIKWISNKLNHDLRYLELS